MNQHNSQAQERGIYFPDEHGKTIGLRLVRRNKGLTLLRGYSISNVGAQVERPSSLRPQDSWRNIGLRLVRKEKAR